MPALLDVRDLTIGLGLARPVLDNISFSVERGETLALVGESGSGKTLSCRAILQILPKIARIQSGTITLNSPGKPALDLCGLEPRAMRAIRGDRISMIFQEPMQSLSPLHTLGDQVTEVLYLHRAMGRADAQAAVLREFAHVGFADPERAFRAYPFEMSGGMRQRAMIAMAMVAKPDLLIADEPTTALDVTTQAQVLGLIKSLQVETGMAVIFVTHDLGVVANIADKVVVLRRGRVMEAGKAADVLGRPAHGYTRALLAATPASPSTEVLEPDAASGDAILELHSVSKTYRLRARAAWGSPALVAACRNIDLSVPRGKTLAIVGESGSGKTTCARMVLGAERPDPGGAILFRATPGGDPVDIHAMSPAERVTFRTQLQAVFQDPYSSFNPRMSVGDALAEPMEINNIGQRAERRDRAIQMLRQVGLDASAMNRFPHAFSGGQRQRLSIARALMMDPMFLVCDEPTSALDVSIQGHILALLEDLQDQRGLSYLFISHDLAVVARIADEVAVMRGGIVVEQARPSVLFNHPVHPYTRALIAARPDADVARKIDLKVVAQGAGDPEGWPEAFRISASQVPPLQMVQPGHRVRCHV
ncbi:dipeptide ABC transporter ATP-binding protein [bacterium]|nr:dipeptide ABC transporter ATP-binding protein [bacterium]